MRYQSLALLAMACTVALAREDTAELCTGALSRLCGRSTIHCSHSLGCNELKGTCGVVVMDHQELPRVISYSDISQGSMKDLVKQLVDQGSHVSPDEQTLDISVENILEGGLTEKENMVTSGSA
ncbi:hypothetical protein BGX33_011530 [Mortierella sp. NVP41]|nr:hypothetical protein BGX33_011530 [Mortierella sp. NVP41]